MDALGLNTNTLLRWECQGECGHYLRVPPSCVTVCNTCIMYRELKVTNPKLWNRLVEDGVIMEVQDEQSKVSVSL